MWTGERICSGFMMKKHLFNDDNELTFITFSEAEWAFSVGKLDSIQTVWERSVESATDEQLRKWSSSVATSPRKRLAIQDR